MAESYNDSDNSEYSDWHTIIGANMRYFRRASGFSQQDIAQVLGVSYQQIQKYEHGINRFPIEKLYELKQFYGVPFELFFRDLPPEGQVRTNAFQSKPEYKIYLQLRSVKDSGLKEKIYRIITILIAKPEKEMV